MEITGKGSSVNLKAYMSNLKDKQKMEPVSEKPVPPKTEGDKVALSPRAKEIVEAKKIIDSMPDIREEKVAAIKKEIENGTYKVDGKKVAVNMIKESILNEWL